VTRSVCDRTRPGPKRGSHQEALRAQEEPGDRYLATVTIVLPGDIEHVELMLEGICADANASALSDKNPERIRSEFPARVSRREKIWNAKPLKVEPERFV
jgi:hypothetical protein